MTEVSKTFEADISQALSHAMRRAASYRSLTLYQRESLEMIQVNIARILEGDRNNIGRWHDIAGYATLVERHLHQEFERLSAQAMERR